MAVRLLFLGRLSDVAGGEERMFDLAEPAPVDEVIGRLEPALAGALHDPRVRVALNGTLATRASLVEDAAELAFLPPVSGG